MPKVLEYPGSPPRNRFVFYEPEPVRGGAYRLQWPLEVAAVQKSRRHLRSDGMSPGGRIFSSPILAILATHSDEK